MDSTSMQEGLFGEAPVTAPTVDSVDRRDFPRSYWVFKRAFDLVFASLALLVLAPIFFLIALAIFVTDGAPIAYAHRRVGKDGKPFNVLKFRTMVRNADKVLQQNPELFAEFQVKFKLEKDPRVTPIGRFLRKTSADELPQLINVVRGEMSLVGPRPIVTAELDRYGDQPFIYEDVMPGCAGEWQASGRSNTSYDERIALDCVYYQRASFWYDLGVLIRTVWAIVRGTGAH